MARMIVLDASVVIALLDGSDAHHDASRFLLNEAADVPFSASVLTIAEALVHPTLQQKHELAQAAIDDIGVRIIPLGVDDALPLARIRAQYRLRMPDAAVLHAALSTRSSIITFDEALTTAAAVAGVGTAGFSDRANRHRATPITPRPGSGDISDYVAEMRSARGARVLGDEFQSMEFQSE